MSKNKVVTIRLKADDVELKNFIDDIPSRRKSVVLREMLLFALKYGKEKREKSVENQVNTQNLLTELEEIKSQLIINQSTSEEIKEMVTKLNVSENKTTTKIEDGSDNKSKKDENEDDDGIDVESTVNSMLAMFDTDNY